MPETKLPSFKYGQIQYRKLIGVSASELGDMGLDLSVMFRMAQNVQTAPAVASEAAHLARFFPIVFAPKGLPMPITLFRLSVGANPFVKDGAWRKGVYLPAAIRRYPFLLGPAGEDGHRRFMIDSTAIVRQRKDENMLFDDAGEPSELLNYNLKFCGEYDREIARTRDICQSLDSHGLFLNKQITYRNKDGQQCATDSLRVLDMSKLDTLSDVAIASLQRSGALAFAYAHQVSMGQIDSLVSREARAGGAVRKSQGNRATAVS